MGFWAWLFRKKEKGLGEDDGQAKYFKEDFDVVERKKTVKKQEKTKGKQEKDKLKAPVESKAKTPRKNTVEITENSPEIKNANTVKVGRITPSGKFDIKKAKDGRFFFSLYASNGAAIAFSQLYSSQSAVNTGIKSIIKNVKKAGIEDATLKKSENLPCPKWEIYIDKAGKYRFRLYATNGQCVCHSSHGYSSKSGCKGGIESIRKFAKDAKVNKSYLK